MVRHRFFAGEALVWCLVSTNGMFKMCSRKESYVVHPAKAWPNITPCELYLSTIRFFEILTILLRGGVLLVTLTLTLVALWSASRPSIPGTCSSCTTFANRLFVTCISLLLVGSLVGFNDFIYNTLCIQLFVLTKERETFKYPSIRDVIRVDICGLSPTFLKKKKQPGIFWRFW